MPNEMDSDLNAGRRPAGPGIALPTAGDSAGVVNLLAGLPTPAVESAFERVRAGTPVQPFAEFVGSEVLGAIGVTILVPPHIETSLLVENWEGCNYLSTRFGEGARIANVITLIDADFLSDQLSSSEPISAYGWGKTARDARSVADIVVGQIESASHLVLVGRMGATPRIHRLLSVLNPKASRCRLEDIPADGLLDFIASSRSSSGAASSRSSARIVPPWLDLLHSEGQVTPSDERFLYRRSLPFDRQRLGQWMKSPPLGLVRGKGSIWLAGDHSRAFGYSCAGSVHRIFAGAPWWAGRNDGVWPACETDRKRLLQRWHLSFGDRRQEIVFMGLDLDPAELSRGLDACLLSEEEAHSSLSETTSNNHRREYPALRLELH